MAKLRIKEKPNHAGSRLAEIEQLHDRVERLTLEVENLRFDQVQMEESRDRYSYYFDYAPQTYVVLDLSGSIEEINLTGAQLLNQPRDRMIGQSLESFMDTAHRQKFRAHLAMCLAGRPGEITRTTLLLTPHLGAPVPVELFTALSQRPRTTARGLSPLLKTIIVDLSEQRQAEHDHAVLTKRERVARASAEQANRSKDEFLAVVSHELRTPLQPILSWIELLRMNLKPENLERGLAIIERSARAQARIIDDLLDMSRANSGKLLIRKSPLDLIPVVRNVLDAVRPEAEAAGLDFQVEIQPQEARLEGDAVRLEQVLRNLLSNAFKFTPKGGKVGVLVRRVPGYAVEIRVSDTGRGIQAEFVPKLFARFTQADTGSTRGRGGLGLGLAISSHLIEQHGGSVRAQSEGLGRGSTFTVRLPLAPALPAPRPSVEPVSREQEKTVLKGLRVLLIDDEEDARDALAASLEGLGLSVRKAGSAEESLALLKTERPDVLLSDISMPGEDGYSLIRRVRKLSASAGGEIPAAALTAHATEEDRKRALEAGFQEHIAKPVDSRALAQAVLRLAGRS